MSGRSILTTPVSASHLSAIALLPKSNRTIERHYANIFMPLGNALAILDTNSNFSTWQSRE